MKKKGIASIKGHFVFGQIYGMGEQLSMPLGKNDRHFTNQMFPKLFQATDQDFFHAHHKIIIRCVHYLVQYYILFDPKKIFQDLFKNLDAP